MRPDGPVPQVIRERHAPFWWALMFMWLATCIAQAFGLDLLGSLTSGLMAYIVCFMVKENCEKMTQYCLLLFGIMSSMSAGLQLISLLTVLGGRVSQATLIAHPGAQSTDHKTLTVSIEKHPFFDGSQGLTYNIQSATLIASPLCNLLGAILSYISYQAYPAPLFEDPEIQPVAGVGGLNALPLYDGGASQFSGQGRRLGGDLGRPTVEPFMGQAHTLGETT